MGMFLNSIVPFESYKDIARTRFFVDKTPMIDEILSSVILDGQKYLCFTRPRRFGKSVMANMIGAFFERSAEGKDVFGSLKIAGSDNYQNHLNRHDIIYIDFSRMPRNCNSYEYYISRIQDGINKDLQEAFPELSLSDEWAVWDNLQFIFEKLKARFIFVIDEWDAIFHKDFITEAHRKKYTEFLRNLLKEQGYVEFVYMTGVLPIAKYSDGSELNMFQEYSIATRVKFCEYFGFLDSEVDDLYGRYLKTVRNPQISRDDLRSWYDGYYTKGGERVYNPRSVICALTDNELANYWTSSGTYDSVFSYIKDNISKVQDDITVLYAGGRVPSDIQEYAASSMRLETKDEIYSSMVVYGLLTYKDGAVSIPNRELMDSFSVMMKRERSLGYIYNLANASRKMLSATLSGDTETMADILKLAHDTESPVLSYNSEIELAAVVNLVYLAARDRYRVEREDKAGEGYVDFIFYPERRSEDGIILELKVDDTAEHAIRQIRERNYALRFTGKLGEKPKYTGRILAVGISYSRKTKEHFCKVEVLSPVSNNP
nr:AAA family ATPase [uncultured Acetatifactor sp.]